MYLKRIGYESPASYDEFLHPSEYFWRSIILSSSRKLWLKLRFKNCTLKELNFFVVFLLNSEKYILSKYISQFNSRK